MMTRHTVLNMHVHVTHIVLLVQMPLHLSLSFSLNLLNWTYFIDINQNDLTQVQKLGYSPLPVTDIVYKSWIAIQIIYFHCVKFHIVFFKKYICIYMYIRVTDSSFEVINNYLNLPHSCIKFLSQFIPKVIF